MGAPASGRLAQRQGEPGRAAQLLREALALILDLDHQPGLTTALTTLAALASDLRQPEPAARLLGALGRLIQEPGRARALPIGFRADYELGLTRVRQALGNGAFERARERGAVMALDELMAAADALCQAVPAAPRPTFGLSPRELEVLAKMAEGQSNRAIADALFISLRTVTVHVTSILGKLQLPSRTAAVAFAIRAGLA